MPLSYYVGSKGGNFFCIVDFNLKNMKNITVLDVVIIILGSATLSLFLFWSSGEFAGIRIFENPPLYLKVIASNLFAILTTGVFATSALALVRKQILKGAEPPHYLPIILVVTLMFVALIVAISKIIPKDRGVDTTTKVSLVPAKYTVKEGYEQSGENYRLDVVSNFYSKNYKNELNIYYSEINSLESMEGCISNPISTTDQVSENFGYSEGDECDGDKLEIRDGGISKFTTRFYRVNVHAFCRARDGLTAILVGKWTGSATTVGPLMQIKFDPGSNRFIEEEISNMLDSPDSEADKLVRCSTGEKSFDLKNESATLCSCAYEQTLSFARLSKNFIENVKIARKGASGVEWSRNIPNIEYESMPPQICNGASVKFTDIENFNGDIVVGANKLSEFVERIKLLGPFQKDADEFINTGDKNPFTYQYLNTGNFEVTVIGYIDGYNSWSQAFYKKVDSNYWKMFHRVSLGYKKMHPLKLVSINADNSVLAEVCIDSCGDHWGQRRKVEIDFRKQSYKLKTSLPDNACS